MTIAGRTSVIPLELQLQQTKVTQASGLTSLLLAVASVLKRGWWHAKSYLSIVGVFLLAAGSLLVLYFHWLTRRLFQLSLRQKEVVKDVGCIR